MITNTDFQAALALLTGDYPIVFHGPVGEWYSPGEIVEGKITDDFPVIIIPLKTDPELGTYYSK